MEDTINIAIVSCATVGDVRRLQYYVKQDGYNFIPMNIRVWFAHEWTSIEKKRLKIEEYLLRVAALEKS